MKIEIHHVTKIIRGITVMNDASLTLESGVIYGLRGVNGSGKTMLMRLIAGLIRPTRGEVLIDGKRLGRELSFPPDMGFLIESPAFLDHFTAHKNLQLLADIRGVADDARICEVLEQVGLDPRDKRRYRQFSLGMKQRLGIAGAVLEHPGLLLIDEPTNALDTDGIDMVKSILLQEKARGALIVLACHDFEILKYLSDQIFSVREGCVAPL